MYNNLQNNKGDTMIYFTSDLHFGHQNVISLCGRPFNDLEEMTNILVENFNKVVHKDDIVYILGDLSFRISSEKAEQIISMLKGRKILVIGNHDKQYNPYLFEELCSYKEIHYNKQRICLMHYPMLEWKNSRHGSIHLHGHIHSKTNQHYDIAGFAGKNYNIDNKELGIRRYDVGVDANDFKPVSIKHILEFMEIEDI